MTTATDGGTETNGRVTLALVGAKLDGLAESFADFRVEVKQWRGEIREWQNDCEYRVRDLERIAAVNQTKIAMIIGGSAGIGGIVGALISTLARVGGAP